MITAAEFGAAVAQHLLPVMRDLGLGVASQADFSVRFEAQQVFVQVDYDSGRSHELNLWIGQLHAAEPPFALADILRATDCPREMVSWVNSIEISDQAVLDRQLAMCAEVLATCAASF